jgi:Mrp family chromosome partitioning ATPase
MNTIDPVERLSAAGPEPKPLEARREADAPEVALPRPQPKAELRYRLIAVRLEALLARKNGAPEHAAQRLGKVVIVTSAQRDDGTTTTALHLASALARALGRRVALVDADLTRPGLAPMLGLGSGQGLTDVLDGAATLDDVLLRGEDGGPLLCPAGGPAGRAIAQGRHRGLSAILNTLREDNDVVVVDTPPLADTADAAILARNADGVVLVVRAGSTREEALAAALEALVDAPLLGLILNDHDGPALGARGAIKPTVWEEDD